MSRKVFYALTGLAFATAASAQQTTQLPSFDLNATEPAPAAEQPAAPGVLAGGCPDDGTISLECVVNFGKFDQTTQAAVEVTQAAAAVAAQPSAQPVALPQIDIEVQFGYDSFQLTPQAIGRLAPLQALLSDPAVRDKPILIVGHTDSVGGYAYNQELSRKRAVAVATHVSAITGIPYDRFLPVGMGYEVLKYPHDPRAAGNRRVTVAWASGS
ncbi:MAG: OmpA family protein [Paracoccaceae bacterium]|nr:OmpA family protein [Maritimibacter sp.]